MIAFEEGFNAVLCFSDTSPPIHSHVESRPSENYRLELHTYPNNQTIKESKLKLILNFILLTRLLIMIFS